MITKKFITQMSYEVVGCAIEVHKTLGPELLESVYEKCFVQELILNGFRVESQIIIPIEYKGLQLDADLKLDLLINNLIIVELKAVEEIHPAYRAQLLTYMKLMKKPQGLLINFFTSNITKSTIPLVNDYFEELPD